ncbi:SOS response-associated peptidase [Marinihelvus fidelis]|uniref:Abasic site processing protein n=1 Tax=Marinihelvus fidelis TaxID=2613842 RepID=A0A5N0TBW7_9GAMM|nr:SOS response-associated peptidase family protein [Marinihelvus fidelis]KAA9131914.1 SOS response-associated peptidase [Marinihelvus fidelis]
MCGKASVSALSWKDIYAWANLLSPSGGLPADPESRINVSPSRQRRVADPGTTVWESLPATLSPTITGEYSAVEATWPFMPPWSRGRLPRLKSGQWLSTANARLRREGDPFARTFMTPWRGGFRAVAWVSWFYEFDSRVKPQVPYAVFNLEQPFWPMAALVGRTETTTGESAWSISIITVEPNAVLRSVGHHRSPALLRNGDEVRQWLEAPGDQALGLLRPYPEEQMGVEAVPMDIKIPGNQDVVLPEALLRHAD